MATKGHSNVSFGGHPKGKNTMTKQVLSAIYCPELRELMLESGRSIRVPEPIAKAGSDTRDARFIKAWAAMHQLIPAGGSIGIFESA
ncbi:MAG: hypothetical protein ACJARL_001553 [Halopseudomonas sp.]